MSELTGAQKAAILLLNLGIGVAAKITQKMDQAVAFDLMRHCANLKELDSNVSEAVVQEFWEQRHKVNLPTGRDFVAELMKQVGGADPLHTIDVLHRLDKNQLLEVVRNEHPQVAAFVLAYIQPDLAAQLLAELTADQQLEVATRIATSEAPSREVLTHLARTLGSRWNNLLGSEAVVAEVAGLDSLVRIMKGVGREVEQNILIGFSEQRPELADELKKNMFVFDDLVLLDDKAIQKLLKEVDGKVLALALKRASSDIFELVARNMSERARNILKEDLEAAGKVRVRDVDRAQSEVVLVVRRLEESGEISIGRDDETFV